MEIPTELLANLAPGAANFVLYLVAIISLLKLSVQMKNDREKLDKLSERFDKSEERSATMREELSAVKAKLEK